MVYENNLNPFVCEDESPEGETPETPETPEEGTDDKGSDNE